MARPIGTLGTIDTLTIGGRTFTDLTNLISLVGVFAGSTDIYCTFRKSNGSAGYTPSGSNRFQLGALVNQSVSIAATAGDYFVMAQSDNDAGFPSSTTLTNPVYVAANASLFINLSQDTTKQTAEFINYFNFIIANGKYLSIAGNSITGANSRWLLTAYGYEIT